MQNLQYRGVGSYRTERAMVKVVNDILLASEKECKSVRLLGFIAAFETID